MIPASPKACAKWSATSDACCMSVYASSLDGIIVSLFSRSQDHTSSSQWSSLRDLTTCPYHLGLAFLGLRPTSSRPRQRCVPPCADSSGRFSPNAHLFKLAPSAPCLNRDPKCAQKRDAGSHPASRAGGKIALPVFGGGSECPSLEDAVGTSRKAAWSWMRSDEPSLYSRNSDQEAACLHLNFGVLVSYQARSAPSASAPCVVLMAHWAVSNWSHWTKERSGSK